MSVIHFLERSFIAEIVINWTDAKSSIYRNYVAQTACRINDHQDIIFEQICLNPEFFVRWVNYCYKKGASPTAAAIQIEKTFILLTKSRNKKYEIFRIPRTNDGIPRKGK